MRLAKPGGLGLGGKLLLSLATVLCLATAASIGVFFPLYHHELAAESRLAARRLAQALGIALEQRTLAADQALMQTLVDRLGAVEGITAISLLGPELETRISTDPAARGTRAASLEAVCVDCSTAAMAEGISSATVRAGGATVLRTVLALDPRPSAGFLVVDHDPAPLQHRARRTAALVSLGAVLITLLALGATWLALRRLVLRPVSRLHIAAQGIAAGDLGMQVPEAPMPEAPVPGAPVPAAPLPATDGPGASTGASTGTSTGADEMAALGRAFNVMADRLSASMAQLRERDAFLQGVIDAVPDGIRVIADDFSIVAANRNFARQVGLSAQQVTGRPCYAVSHGRTEPCVSTVVVCPVVALAAEEGPVKCTHLHRRGGQEFAVEVVAARLPAADGAAPRRYVVESVRELSHDVEVSLGQRLSEIGQLATGVAHEIHNPLASVQFGLRALQDAIDQPGRGAEIEEYFRLVSREIERCIEVTGRLMRLSEASSGQGTLIDLDALARSVCSLLRYEAESRRIALDVEFRESPRIIACESDVGMVLINLVQNAFHATPAGGRIAVTGELLADGNVALEVADTGSGIGAADLERIFLPFWSHRADRSEGSGLGLPICKALVRKWRGAISVSSREGEGTRFRMVFPSPDKVLDAA